MATIGNIKTQSSKLFSKPTTSTPTPSSRLMSVPSAPVSVPSSPSSQAQIKAATSTTTSTSSGGGRSSPTATGVSVVSTDSPITDVKSGLVLGAGQGVINIAGGSKAGGTSTRTFFKPGSSDEGFGALSGGIQEAQLTQQQRASQQVGALGDYSQAMSRPTQRGVNSFSMPLLIGGRTASTQETAIIEPSTGYLGDYSQAMSRPTTRETTGVLSTLYKIGGDKLIEVYNPETKAWEPRVEMGISSIALPFGGTATKTASGVWNVIKQISPMKAAKSLAIFTGIGIASTQGAKQISLFTMPTNASQFTSNKTEFKEAYRFAESKAMNQTGKGFFTNLGSSIPILRNVLTGTEFKKGTEEWYTSKNITGSNLTIATEAQQRYRTASQTGELVGLAGGSLSTELGGGISAAYKFLGQPGKIGVTKAAGYLFKKLAPTFIEQGIGEGGGTVLTMRSSFDQSLLSKESLKQTVYGSTIGAITTPILGTGIAAAPFVSTAKGKIYSRISKGGFFLDIYEKPIDIFSERVAAPIGRKVGFDIPELRYSINKQSNEVTFSSIGKKIPTTISNPTSIFISSPTSTPISDATTRTSNFIPTTTKTTTVQGKIGGKTQTFNLISTTTTTPTSNFIPTFIPTTTPTTIPTSIPTYVPTTQPSTIPTTIPITVPIITPQGGGMFVPGIDLFGRQGSKSSYGSLFGRYTPNLRGLMGSSLGTKATRGQTRFTGLEIRPVSFSLGAQPKRRRRK